MYKFTDKNADGGILIFKSLHRNGHMQKLMRVE